MSNKRDPLLGTSYRTLETLGHGSMGRVVSAEHSVLKHRVCVKILHPEAAAIDSVVDRFRVEGQALATLGGGKHPHLVHVNDIGVTGAGLPFLVMEHLTGRTLLDERKARGAIPWREVTGWMLQALSAVEVAHKAGVVHRDLKPANIFLCDPQSANPTIKVLDFGIAKLLDPTGPIDPAKIATGVGYLVGTPRYASPEQVKCIPIDTRCDLYAMGLVLFELVSGQVPFADKRRSDEILIAQVRDLLPALASVGARDVPDDLDAIVARATAKDPDHRYASAAEFVSALRDLLERKAEILHSTEPVAVNDTAPMAVPPRFDSLADPSAPAPATETPKPRRIAETLPMRAGAPQVANVGAKTEGGLPQRPAAASATAQISERGRFITVLLASTLLFAAVGWWVMERWLG